MVDRSLVLIFNDNREFVLYLDRGENQNNIKALL
jgi:hypothetical protein